MGTRIAVVGATGNVGRELLNILDERLFLPMRSTPSPPAAPSARKSPMATAP